MLGLCRDTTWSPRDGLPHPILLRVGWDGSGLGLGLGSAIDQPSREHQAATSLPSSCVCPRYIA